ncbi:MAG: T9SS type A sorting domain-containing protein [Ekhidna sp.]
MVNTSYLIRKIGCFFSLILLSLNLFSQSAIFLGGSGDGHSQSSYTQAPPLGNDLFLGSAGDGHDFNSYKQNSATGTDLYLGGIGDGHAQSEFLQATPVGVSLYLGGDGDGADYNSYEQDLTITFGVYTGGIGDGYASNEFQQASTIGSEIFLGGTDDGHATSSFEQQVASGFAIYGGGLGDGHATDVYIQNAATSFTLFYGGLGDGYDVDGYQQSVPPGTNLFAGGSGDGADQDDYEQGVVAVFGVYTGGEGDGFDVAEYEQTDFIDALPVELTSFSVALVEDWIDIRWSTATETNNHYFLVQRSNDLKQWMVLDSVQGAGNSNAVIEYMSADRSPRTTINYYRLQQVDYDGTTSYSMIRIMDLNGVKQAAELLVYPNPVRDRINLQFTGFRSDEMLLKIYDASGRLVHEKKLKLASGQGLYEINRTTKMLEGYYIVIATDAIDGTTRRTRMLVK